MSIGGAKCWGDNGFGQVGDNTTTARAVPTDVSGLTSGVAGISVGAYHSCALTKAGGVKCWGFNGEGRLGDNTITDRHAPVDVSGLTSGVTAVSAGGAHTCALTAAGGVKCWGANGSGQLGDNSLTERHVPADVSGLTNGVAAISVGGDHTCALTTGGGVKCWGGNDSGQLGDNSTTEHHLPTDVSGLTSGVTAVSAGLSYTCARTTAGGVKCWGDNTNGKLGDNTTTERHVPTDVSGLTSGGTTVVTGAVHTCAMTTAGGAKCWGSNVYGLLGDNTTTERHVPADVSGLTSGVIAVSAGINHTCAQASGSTVKCWGYNGLGQLGDNTNVERHVPVDVVAAVHGEGAISAANHSCLITTGGGVKCWGPNGSGQLGDNTTTMRPVATAVSGLTGGVVAVATGDLHTCALTAAGGVKCWGENGSGELGDNSNIQRHTPVDVSGLTTGVVAISAGESHTCALTTAGGVKCWGDNSAGRLGDNSTLNKKVPTDVTNLTSGVLAISAGGSHTCALTSIGGMKCWGYNGLGQLGDNTTSERHIPVDVSGLTSGVAAIAAGSLHTCAVTAAGGVKCWGSNGSGRLGDDTITERHTPVDVVGLTSGATAVAAGVSHTCALTTTGGVRCWGYNGGGRLGDDTLTERHTPVDVSGLTSGGVAVATDTSHSCALTTTGVVKCWGGNLGGRLGDNTATERHVPADVVEAFSISPTFTAAPNAAGLISPAVPGLGNPLKFTWIAADRSTWYYLWIQSSSTVFKQWYSAADAGCDQKGVCTLTAPTTLVPGNYTWWVQSWNSAGSGPWSASRSFTLPLPAKATLLGPMGNAVYPSSFAWVRASDATYYYLWIDRVDQATTNVFAQWYTADQVGCSSANTCVVAAPLNLSAGNYRWYVQTWNSNGYGPWSSSMSFTVNKPGKASPATPTGTVFNPVTYTWNAVNGATYYYLWVDRGANNVIKKWFTAAAVGCAPGMGATCSINEGTTLSVGNYTWWIQTWNPAGYGPWSDGKTFTVNT